MDDQDPPQFPEAVRIRVVALHMALDCIDEGDLSADFLVEEARKIEAFLRGNDIPTTN